MVEKTAECVCTLQNDWLEIYLEKEFSSLYKENFKNALLEIVAFKLKLDF